ncbi:hypothetical protein H112_01222 [Trichophyton rubrum D6]|uniref:VPS4-associated protein 1 n=2 Tax=Trichophyton TaxID=5550 RepID=A0A022WDY5_TRIRU|nr:hypothetical protein H100_01215 [Trichophyton rubrum MR850]EZF45782.1 hypothetical protein H102_01212 [Trichophyton rubrum CBS 100081]EZF56356.1 hypothetical protein H103_01219 [Trichophyton rubrum CBS 288.86]EZF66939.1 hypothetical protein H104_01205 [Trichophyton rubrum CBS 289.86]EZF77578.1 hypothetical protein H105_01225 [Trichophyton soudanense CBS 452.61]EZF88284.1 hypothetical protein H110_01222 [Trichophyton rubrum MR1448]EZF99119.1 hypothetical protein H113_01222 [Trichophyton rub
MAQLLQNRWHLRRVADTSAKSCLICYKPSTSVLVTPDSKDFFYVCLIHLKDKGFCSPLIDEEEVAAKKRKEEMDREIEKVKKQYEEKQRRKRDKEKDGEKTDDKKKADDEEESKKAEKERDDKIKSIQNAASPLDASTDDMPRIYSLHKNFYQMRVDRLKAIEKSKRDRQRLQNPSTFPSVPKTDLS